MPSIHLKTNYCVLKESEIGLSGLQIKFLFTGSPIKGCVIQYVGRSLVELKMPWLGLIEIFHT